MSWRYASRGTTRAAHYAGSLPRRARGGLCSSVTTSGIWRRSTSSRVCGPGVAGEHDDGVVFGEHDPFLDDEIHAVTDGVDEHHVGYPQRSERTRIVVADIE